jgi:hypothetical protein
MVLRRLRRGNMHSCRRSATLAFSENDGDYTADQQLQPPMSNVHIGIRQAPRVAWAVGMLEVSPNVLRRQIQSKKIKKYKMIKKW